MARSHRLRLQADASGAARHARSLLKKAKVPYKVVFEQVSERKKKLITVLSFDSRAPPGYTFIPAGDPSITNRCKELAREDKSKVFIVSTSRHKHQANLSHEVHRIGYHFPSLIVEKACMSLGVSLTQSGLVIPLHGKRTDLESNHYPLIRKNNSRATNDMSNANVSQATLDIQAQQAIKDLFPKIPSRDLRAIVGRAFQKGKSRVGTAVELPISRRVQLAVVAHIRHVYTDYDNLLKTGTYHEARAAVEKPCLDLLAQWRSDDDDDPNAMEDILREVIVIDDDDDEDTNRKSPLTNHDYSNRDNSVEIISSHTFADELQTRRLKYSSSSQIAPSDHLHGRLPDVSAVKQYTELGQYNHNSRYQNDIPRPDSSSVHLTRWREALHRRKNSFSSYINNNSRLSDSATAEVLALQRQQRELKPQLLSSDGVQQKLRVQSGGGNDWSQTPFHIQLMPAQQQANAAISAEQFVNRVSNGFIPESRQVILSEEQHPRDRSLEYVDPSSREAAYSSSNHLFDRRSYDHLPLMKNRRAAGDQYIETDSPYGAYHQRRFLPHRQTERVLPSVEGSSQDGRQLYNKFDVSSEHSSKHSNLSPSFDREQKPRHRIVKLSNKKQNKIGKGHMHDELVLLPARRLQQISRQHHDSPEHSSRVNAFSPQEYTSYIYPINKMQVSEMDEATQTIRGRTTHKNNQNQVIDHGQAKYTYHEPLETLNEVKQIELRKQRQHDSLNRGSFHEYRPQLTDAYSDFNCLPSPHVPSKSHHYVGSNNARQITHSRADEGNLTRFENPDHGAQSNVKSLDNNLKNQRHNSLWVQGDENHPITYPNNDDDARVGIQDKLRTGIFLRKIDGQKKYQDNTSTRFENPPLGYQFERSPGQKFQKIISVRDELNSIQARPPGAGIHFRNPIIPLPKSELGKRYELGKELPHYAFINGEESIVSSERHETINHWYGPKPLNSVSLDQRRQPEIIEID